MSRPRIKYELPPADFSFGSDIVMRSTQIPTSTSTSTSTTTFSAPPVTPMKEEEEEENANAVVKREVEEINDAPMELNQDAEMTPPPGSIDLSRYTRKRPRNEDVFLDQAKKRPKTDAEFEEENQRCADVLRPRVAELENLNSAEQMRLMLRVLQVPLHREQMRNILKMLEVCKTDFSHFSGAFTNILSAKDIVQLADGSVHFQAFHVPDSDLARLLPVMAQLKNEETGEKERVRLIVDHIGRDVNAADVRNILESACGIVRTALQVAQSLNQLANSNRITRRSIGTYCANGSVAPPQPQDILQADVAKLQPIATLLRKESTTIKERVRLIVQHCGRDMTVADVAKVYENACDQAVLREGIQSSFTFLANSGQLVRRGVGVYGPAPLVADDELPVDPDEEAKRRLDADIAKLHSIREKLENTNIPQIERVRLIFEHCERDMGPADVKRIFDAIGQAGVSTKSVNASLLYLFQTGKLKRRSPGVFYHEPRAEEDDTEDYPGAPIHTLESDLTKLKRHKAKLQRSGSTLQERVKLIVEKCGREMTIDDILNAHNKICTPHVATRRSVSTALSLLSQKGELCRPYMGVYCSPSLQPQHQQESARDQLKSDLDKLFFFKSQIRSDITPQSERVRLVVQHCGRPVTADEVHKLIKKLGGRELSRKNVENTLSTLASSGKVKRVCFGVYCGVSNPVDDTPFVNPDKVADQELGEDLNELETFLPRLTSDDLPLREKVRIVVQGCKRDMTAAEVSRVVKKICGSEIDETQVGKTLVNLAHQGQLQRCDYGKYRGIEVDE